jgi:hypothetical protein
LARNGGLGSGWGSQRRQVLRVARGLGTLPGCHPRPPGALWPMRPHRLGYMPSSYIAKSRKRDPRLADTWRRRSTLSPCRSTTPRSWPECRRSVEHSPAEQLVNSYFPWRESRSRHAASTSLKLHELVAFLIALCACVNTSTSYNRSNC